MMKRFKWNNHIYFRDNSSYFKKRKFKNQEIISEETFKRAQTNYLRYREKVDDFNREQVEKLKKKIISLRNSTKKTVIDLFCGCGGLSLGFEKAGFDVILAIDNDFSACQTYAFNFKNSAVLCLDLTNPEANPAFLKEELNLGNLNVDLVIGSPPCQGFSLIARSKIRSLIENNIWDDHELRNGDINNKKDTHWLYNDPRNILYKKFLNYVNFFKPLIFLMENVPGMNSYNKIIQQIRLDFEDVGYSIQKKILNSVDFNVPQKRKRLFIIGVDCNGKKVSTIRNNHILQPQKRSRNKSSYPPIFKFPDKTSKYRLLNDEIITVRDAIGDLNQITLSGEKLDYNIKGVKSEYVKLIRRNLKEKNLFNFVPRKTVERDKKIYQFLKEGDKYKNLPKLIRNFYSQQSHIKENEILDNIIDDTITECMPYGDGKKFGDKLKRLIWDQPSWTVVAHIHKDGYMYIHPEQDRTISVREAARLQSFPDEFVFKSSRTNQFKHVGNAVPPLMSQVLAHHLLDYFESLKNQK